MFDLLHLRLAQELCQRNIPALPRRQCQAYVDRGVSGRTARLAGVSRGAIVYDRFHGSGKFALMSHTPISPRMKVAGDFGFALSAGCPDFGALRENYAEPVFKGWAKPGPIPPGAMGDGPVVEAGETLDAISGFFRLFQLAEGHRFSTDDILTAWYGTICCPTAQRALDLGSGLGAVGMIAAWRLPGAQFVTVEAQAESVRLARKSASWNGLEGRYEIRHGDFRDASILRPEEKFDLVLGSPPYFPQGSGGGRESSAESGLPL